MRRRFRFLNFCILFLGLSFLGIAIFLSSNFTVCNGYICKKTTECSYSIKEEALLIAEFGIFKNSEDDNDSKGGVISFEVDNILYSVGHCCYFNNIDDISVYKTVPEFDPSLSRVILKEEKIRELISEEIIQDSYDGVLISSYDLNSKTYQTIDIANKIYSGNAELLMRDETGNLQSYDIVIGVLEDFIEGERLEIEITDEELLSKTGGIVRGMSGSPIIQDGKIIGVVTHSYVNKPWRGKAKIIWNIDCIKNYKNYTENESETIS